MLKFTLQSTLGVNSVTSDAAKQVLNENTTTVTLTSTTTAGAFPSSTFNNISDNRIYTDAKNNFEISYPKSWTVAANGTNNIVVEFDDPTPNLVAVETVAVDRGMTGYSVKQYAAGGMEGFSTAAGSVDLHVKIISQKEFTLAGSPAYEVDFTYNFPLQDGSGVPMRATSVFVIRGDAGYNIFGSSQEEAWSKYEGIFAASTGSFKFLK